MRKHRNAKEIWWTLLAIVLLATFVGLVRGV